jgi:hypothetical protein
MRQTLAGDCAGGAAEDSVGPLETGFGRGSRWQQRDLVGTVEWGGEGPSTQDHPRLGGLRGSAGSPGGHGVGARVMGGSWARCFSGFVEIRSRCCCCCGRLIESH